MMVIILFIAFSAAVIYNTVVMVRLKIQLYNAESREMVAVSEKVMAEHQAEHYKAEVDRLKPTLGAAFRDVERLGSWKTELEGRGLRDRKEIERLKSEQVELRRDFGRLSEDKNSLADCVLRQRKEIDQLNAKISSMTNRARGAGGRFLPKA